MKCLLVIDVQNGFVSEETKDVLPKLEQLTAEFHGGLIIATQFINSVNSGFTDIMHWNNLRTSPEIDLIPFVATAASVLIKKTGYSACTDEVMDLLQRNNITEVYLVGIDTDCCVLTTAISLFEHNIRPVVLEYYCSSNGGSKSHAAALTVLGRTIGEDQIFTGPFHFKDQT